MYAFNTIALTLAVFGLTASAVPSNTRERDLYVRSAPASVTCGNGQVISCCDTSKVNSDNSKGGFLDLSTTLDGVLGGNCQPIGLGLLGIGTPINKACGNNNALCCTGDGKGGLVNTQCNSMNIL